MKASMMERLKFRDPNVVLVGRGPTKTEHHVSPGPNLV